MLRHIAWFNEAPVEPDPCGGLISPDPRVGRRCLIPARRLEDLGVACSVFGNLQDADPLQVSLHLQKLQTDIVVVGNISEPSRLQLARAAKHLGCYVVADLGHTQEVTPDLVKLVEMADRVVAGTPETAALTSKETGATTTVIPDCDEAANSDPSADSVTRLWLECFQQLKLKPPASANSNSPE